MESPTFYLAPAVIVNIDCEPGDDIAKRFLRFCVGNEIWSVRLGSCGPLGLSQAYRPEDIDAIKAWLLENNVKNTGE